jgi:hypothetical protein
MKKPCRSTHAPARHRGLHKRATTEQHKQVPDGYHRRGSGATVGDSHKGPLIAGEKPTFWQIIKTQTNSQIVNYAPRDHDLVTGAHGPGNLSGPSSGRPRHPSGETPLRSRSPVPYHRDLASLEGWTPPRVRPRLT